MMRTKQKIMMVWGTKQHPAMLPAVEYVLTIPAHTRVTLCPDTSGQFFVDDLSWIEDKKSMLHHDATHYGIRLPPERVELAPGATREFYTIQHADVGKRRLLLFGKMRPVDCLGEVLPMDIGKRIYLVGNDATGDGVLQVENTQQFRRRLAQGEKTT